MASTTDRDQLIQQELSTHFVQAVSGLFQCMGRALLCLDRNFVVVHASDGLDDIAGPGARQAVEGLPVDHVLGPDLFGEQGVLRRALLAGERREGWGATLSIPGRPAQMLSVTATSVESVLSPLCDPRIVYMTVVRAIAQAPSSEEPPVRFYAGMIGRSTAMLGIFDFVRSLSESEATVLLTGESGTGKELVARALHEDSPRHSHAFVAVNCGALPGELVKLEFTDSSSSCLIQDPESDSARYVIMPMRL